MRDRRPLLLLNDDARAVACADSIADAAGPGRMAPAPPPPASQLALIDAIAGYLGRGGQAVERFETHISWVLVARGYAYKFKKALTLDFMDCATLEARRHFCQEELRLNRRLSPGLYLDLARVTGDPASPCLDGPGEAIEYAVRMRAFAQSAVWSARLAGGLLQADEIDGLACLLARLHRKAAVAPPDSPWGAAASLGATARRTLAALDRLAPDAPAQQMLAGLRAWHEDWSRRLEQTFERRRQRGMVRECHGDLHAGNILTGRRGVEVFDCIEFSEALRWIDVINDLAFACMDLAAAGRADFATRLRNDYLARTGDYEGLAVMAYYSVHRALVRCLVMLLRAGQEAAADRAPECRRRAQAYLARACSDAGPGRPAIAITHGYSGSGKTTFCRLAAERSGAVHLRSDVERKRLHGMDADDHSGARPGSALYDAAAGRHTYDRLLALARMAVEAGQPVLVDAAFLDEAERRRFAGCARSLGVPFILFDIQASPAVMAQRLAARARSGADASDAGVAVLERQIASARPLTEPERAQAVVVDMEAGLPRDVLETLCRPLLSRAGSGMEGAAAPAAGPRPGCPQ